MVMRTTTLADERRIRQRQKEATQQQQRASLVQFQPHPGGLYDEDDDDDDEELEVEPAALDPAADSNPTTSRTNTTTTAASSSSSQLSRAQLEARYNREDKARLTQRRGSTRPNLAKLQAALVGGGGPNDTDTANDNTANEGGLAAVAPACAQAVRKCRLSTHNNKHNKTATKAAHLFLQRALVAYRTVGRDWVPGWSGDEACRAASQLKLQTAAVKACLQTQRLAARNHYLVQHLGSETAHRLVQQLVDEEREQQQLQAARLEEPEDDPEASRPRPTQQQEEEEEPEEREWTLNNETNTNTTHESATNHAENQETDAPQDLNETPAPAQEEGENGQDLPPTESTVRPKRRHVFLEDDDEPERGTVVEQPDTGAPARVSDARSPPKRRRRTILEDDDDDDEEEEEELEFTNSPLVADRNHQEGAVTNSVPRTTTAPSTAILTPPPQSSSPTNTTSPPLSAATSSETPTPRPSQSTLESASSPESLPAAAVVAALSPSVSVSSETPTLLPTQTQATLSPIASPTSPESSSKNEDATIQYVDTVDQ